MSSIIMCNCYEFLLPEYIMTAQGTQWLRVSATHDNDLGPDDSDKEDDRTTASLPPQAPSTLSWADQSYPDMLGFPLSLPDYQAELIEEMGKQMQKGNPSPILWQEIVTVTDLVLHNSRQCVQACSHSMALSVAAEQPPGLISLVCPTVRKGALLVPLLSQSRLSSAPALTLMQQRCDDKKEDEAFKLCLPPWVTPHLLPSTRPPQPPAVKTPRLGETFFFTAAAAKKPRPCQPKTEVASLTLPLLGG
ncbi:hypothetical protein SKAU_G00096290 [Synaphobranchus kaupii]|uniref:Uncharacterized protein n=1 Tax=Synaphobranchus kaupii TaxID=118154 RepID=A0A9Q1J6Y7_SYNKA|nr:hypothetical protein SKAU_G00096290 [Synaphobranchus kaupii]